MGAGNIFSVLWVVFAILALARQKFYLFKSYFLGDFRNQKETLAKGMDKVTGVLYVLAFVFYCIDNRIPSYFWE